MECREHRQEVRSSSCFLKTGNHPLAFSWLILRKHFKTRNTSSSFFLSIFVSLCPHLSKGITPYSITQTETRDPSEMCPFLTFYNNWSPGYVISTLLTPQILIWIRIFHLDHLMSLLTDTTTRSFLSYSFTIFNNSKLLWHLRPYGDLCLPYFPLFQPSHLLTVTNIFFNL